jgi:hypothetical protein
MDFSELEKHCKEWNDLSEPMAQSDKFSRIIQLTIQILGCPRSLSDEFAVSEDTMEKWAKGAASPHPHYQYMIVDKIKNWINSKNC